MKEKILMLIIVVLLGAIITSGCFMLFSNKGANNRPDGKMRRRFSDGKYGAQRDTSIARNTFLKYGSLFQSNVYRRK